MEQVITVNKPLGLTPLQAITQFRKKFPLYKSAKIGYAGRLDPMAEGLLLLLINDQNSTKEQFEQLDKEYIFEAIFGFETDSYDLLGKVQLKPTSTAQIDKNHILQKIETYKGKITQRYPPFSSVRVNGKPLFHWAFHNKLDLVTIPEKTVSVYDISLLSLHTISAETLQKDIVKKITLVDGNFRQNDILEQWDLFFKQNKHKTFSLLKASIHCSSGTYIRSLVKNLGEALDTKATTYSIKRTTVGDYSLDQSISID